MTEKKELTETQVENYKNARSIFRNVLHRLAIAGPDNPGMILSAALEVVVVSMVISGATRNSFDDLCTRYWEHAEAMTVLRNAAPPKKDMN